MGNNQASPGVLRFVAAAELLLILPAALFMASLFVRAVMPPALGPAQAARQVVDWYSARPFLGLDIFLMALPLAAFAAGCATTLRRWRSDAGLREASLETLVAVRAYLANLLIVGATLAAGCVLAIVAVHVITG